MNQEKNQIKKDQSYYKNKLLLQQQDREVLSRLQEKNIDSHKRLMVTVYEEDREKVNDIIEKLYQMKKKSTMKGNRLSQEMVLNEIIYFSTKNDHPWLIKYPDQRISKMDIIKEMILFSESLNHPWINLLENK